MREICRFDIMNNPVSRLVVLILLWKLMKLYISDGIKSPTIFRNSATVSVWRHLSWHSQSHLKLKNVCFKPLDQNSKLQKLQTSFDIRAVRLYETFLLVLHIHRHSLPLLTSLRYLHTIDSRPLWHLQEAKADQQHPPNRKLPQLPWNLRDPPANAGNISETHATPQLTLTMPHQWLLPHVLSMQLPRPTSWTRELSLMPVASSLMLNGMQSHQDQVCHPFLRLFPLTALCLHLSIPFQTQSPEHNPSLPLSPLPPPAHPLPWHQPLLPLPG